MMFTKVIVNIFEYMAYAESKSIMNDNSRTAQDIADATEVNESIVGESIGRNVRFLQTLIVHEWFNDAWEEAYVTV